MVNNILKVPGTDLHHLMPGEHLTSRRDALSLLYRELGGAIVPKLLGIRRYKGASLANTQGVNLGSVESNLLVTHFDEFLLFFWNLQ
jgi:hypothetical protein